MKSDDYIVWHFDFNKICVKDKESKQWRFYSMTVIKNTLVVQWLEKNQWKIQIIFKLVLLSIYQCKLQDDLWSELTSQAHADGTLPRDLSVKTVMDTWTLQMGFPVVTVTRDYESNTASVEQKRFLVGGKVIY